MISFASPEEIGDFIALMLSDKQGGMGFMAGSDVIVDGGESHPSYLQRSTHVSGHRC